MKRSPIHRKSGSLGRGKPLQRAGRLETKRLEVSVRSLREEEWAAVKLEQGAVCLLSFGGRPWGGCFGPLTPHHLRKAGQGGPYLRSNLVPLCAHHNDEVENRPDDAEALGLNVRRQVDHEEAARRRAAAGLVNPRRTP